MFRIASSLTQLSGRPNGAGLNEIVGMPYINDREQDSNQSCTAQNHHIMMCPCHDHRLHLIEVWIRKQISNNGGTSTSGGLDLGRTRTSGCPYLTSDNGTHSRRTMFQYHLTSHVLW